MTKLAWNSVGSRFFETGVDRGVLYLKDVPGVAWSGLTSISEAPSGGEVTPFYIDGVKFKNATAREDFEATITAYTYPEEFDSCIGVTLIGHGLFATQQKKHSFGLSYRTRVGNDIEGVEHAYKIHIVYNATAETSDQDYKTLGDNTDVGEFSWHIVTRPPSIAGFTPTAHYVIDSRQTTESLLTALEDILYGTNTDEPRLPTLDELIFIFNDYAEQNFDAGFLNQPYVSHYDAGVVGRVAPEVVLDGGTP
jgi:hypothetical protein